MACFSFISKICSGGQEEGLTQKDKDDVQRSWAQASDKKAIEDMGTIFYKQLFTLNPDLLELFSFKDEPNMYESNKLRVQGSRVFRSVAAACSMVNDVDKLVPKLQVLGRAHVGMGVLPAHFPTVGAALLHTLEVTLGNDWNPSLKKSWTKVYGIIAGVVCDSMLAEEKRRAGSD